MLTRTSAVLLAERLMPASVATWLRTAVGKRRNRRNRIQFVSRESTWRSNAGKISALEIEIQPDVIMAAYIDSELCRLIYMGQYELAERQFVHRFLRAGDIFVDVGANVGLYSLHAAKEVGAGGKVYAFEPCSATFTRLADNIQRNNFDNIEIHQVALSDSEGLLSMATSSDGFDAWNSAGKVTMGANFKDESVPCNTWDNFAATRNLQRRVTMMKVDIEGWESYFLSGARESLNVSEAPVILIELNEEAARASESSVAQVKGQLQDLGYTLYCLAPDGFPLSISEVPIMNNVVAVKNIEAVSIRLAERPAHTALR